MHPSKTQSTAELTRQKGGDVYITRKQKLEYQDTEVLRKYLSRLKGRKFRLDCGHHVTFGYYLGNSVTIYNGSKLKIICSQCGY
jgi:hypothetical protein